MENDKKWIYLSYIVGAFIVSWVLNQALLLGVGYLRLPNPQILGVLSSSAVISVVLTGAFTLWYVRRPKVDTFATEVMQEMHKVTWPPRKNTMMSTVVVVISVMIVAVILAMYDWACSSLIGWMLTLKVS